MTSRRAERWTGHDAYLVKAHFACEENPFDPDTNPEGYVNFGTAQNHLVFDAMLPLLRESIEIAERDTHYSELHGARFFREAIAGFLRGRAGRVLSAESVAVATGASAILEILSFTLCDPGDRILIPAPYYPGFDHDLALRSDAVLLPVPLAGPEFRLSVEAIEKVHGEAISRGKRVAALLVSSPNNPLGHVYDEQLVRGMAEFCERRRLHLILDEIYAESLLPGARHFSGLQIESPYVHVVYGFAKDFGLSGYKVGILHSENAAVLKAAQAFSYFHTVPGIVQRVLAGILRNPRLETFLETMRERLDAGYRETITQLSGNGINAVAAQGGIVLWLDLRPFLGSASFETEHRLWAHLFDRCRVSLGPGSAFHCSEPGWFRLCFTVPDVQRREGLTRLRRDLENLRSR